MTFLLLFIPLFLLGIVTFFSLIPWQVHKEMTRETADRYGFGNYKLFVNEFNKKQWEQKYNFPKSFFNYKTNSEIHASIYMFDGKGMVIENPIDYLMIHQFLKKRYLKSKPEVDWKLN